MLLKRDLHKKLFWLLNGWAGKFMANNTANATGKAANSTCKKW
jgi:hypothetical protein